MTDPAIIEDNLHSIQERISAAAGRTQRDPAGIRLIAVSKGQPAEAIRSAFAAGLREFGENYLEEAEPKIRSLDPSITWHMIGHLQSRKAKAAARLFPLIHSLDSLSLARKLSRFAADAGTTIEILLECNLSGEDTKFGFPAAEPAAWAELIREWGEILPLPGLAVAGLMTMAPYSENPETSRPVFRRLRELCERARRDLPQADWRELSMGMSDDFEQAVEEGATMLRIGRALFGPRSRNSEKPPVR
ncbi:MAG: YggS family pyridoxal phosphate-dependent enzyme [Anaerolineales bacterium]|nr:YggS family pyridoxal phosphate-dependent enzyme [Anaerolineales bacterium]